VTTSRLLCSALPIIGFAVAIPASANPCASGGSLTLTAASDSLTTTPTAAAAFNFGEHIILTATATGFSIGSYAWTIDGPTIKDYNENLGTEQSPPLAAPLPWSTTPLAASDLTQSSVSFYWVPSAAQTEPNNGPFTRNVTLAVTKSGGGTCSVAMPYSVERNESDITRQAEDFYTSNHRASTETNPLDGHVVDEHIFWHANVDGNQSAFPAWMGFLSWHGEFVRRFDLWRQEFGYNTVAPWYPGRALPTGPQFDANPSLRLTYNPDNNRIPTYYTITGALTPDFGGQLKLGDYTTLNAFTGSFEGSFHGQIHCNIGAVMGGNSFFETSGTSFGSMCLASSPKDPMFWRWHGFIDTLYRNYCELRPTSCSAPSPADPSADPWMADNSTDIADNGTVPSPGTHWISPDVWNRLTPVTTAACVAPVDAYGDQVTTGGVVRNCGTSADHQNPASGVTNYLYGTLRNTRPNAPRVVYAEVGVYYALASSGLTYPTNFTMVPETRQFIALYLEPGTTTSIGPIPWIPPPVPPLNDHYCLYLRVLSVQATPPVEGLGIDTDVANNNDLAWRNIKVVAPGDTSPPGFFIVRNIGRKTEPLTLTFEVPPALAGGVVRVTLDETLTRALRDGKGRLDGLKSDGNGGFLIASPKAALVGLLMAPREEGHVTIQLGRTTPSMQGDITITQISSRGVDGGVTVRVTAPASATNTQAAP
jgi:hypothetical protein